MTLVLLIHYSVSVVTAKNVKINHAAQDATWPWGWGSIARDLTEL